MEFSCMALCSSTTALKSAHNQLDGDLASCAQWGHAPAAQRLSSSMVSMTESYLAELLVFMKPAALWTCMACRVRASAS